MENEFAKSTFLAMGFIEYPKFGKIIRPNPFPSNWFYRIPRNRKINSPPFHPVATGMYIRPRLCLGSAGSLAVPCLGSVCLALTSSKSGKGLDTTTTAAQPPPAAEGGWLLLLWASTCRNWSWSRQGRPSRGKAQQASQPSQGRAIDTGMG